MHIEYIRTKGFLYCYLKTDGLGTLQFWDICLYKEQKNAFKF
jgi:hypothetical protein